MDGLRDRPQGNLQLEPSQLIVTIHLLAPESIDELGNDLRLLLPHLGHLLDDPSDPEHDFLRRTHRVPEAAFRIENLEDVDRVANVAGFLLGKDIPFTADAMERGLHTSTGDVLDVAPVRVHVAVEGDLVGVDVPKMFVSFGEFGTVPADQRAGHHDDDVLIEFAAEAQSQLLGIRLGGVVRVPAQIAVSRLFRGRIHLVVEVKRDDGGDEHHATDAVALGAVHEDTRGVDVDVVELAVRVLGRHAERRSGAGIHDVHPFHGVHHEIFVEDIYLDRLTGVIIPHPRETRVPHTRPDSLTAGAKFLHDVVSQMAVCAGNEGEQAAVVIVGRGISLGGRHDEKRRAVVDEEDRASKLDETLVNVSEVHVE